MGTPACCKPDKCNCGLYMACCINYVLASEDKTLRICAALLDDFADGAYMYGFAG